MCTLVFAAGNRPAREMVTVSGARAGVSREVAGVRRGAELAA